MSKRTDLTQTKVLCKTGITNTNFLILKEASIRRGTSWRRAPTGPALPRTTPHPPSTLSTSLSRASALQWSSTSSLVWCVVRGEGGPFYSPRRSVSTRMKYGNTGHCLQEDKDDLPAKARTIWRKHGAGRPQGSAGPRAPPLVPPFVLDTARWAPILCMSVPWFCRSVFSIRWAHLVSVTQDEVFCVFLLRLMLVFSLFRVWVPANPPKFMELIRIKFYNYVW